jgi:hypothetical protein
MRRYEPSTPRVAFAVAAVAMSALSLGLTVVLPAEEDTSDEAGNWATYRVVYTASAGVIDVADDEIDVADKPATTGVQCTPAMAERTPKS